MRILITSIGDTEIKEKSFPHSQSTNHIHKQKKLNQIKPCHKLSLSISTEKNIKSPHPSSHSSPKKSSIFSIKTISIKSPKRFFIGQVAKMYDKPLLDSTPSPSIISNQFPSPILLSAEQKQRKQLPLLDIVPSSAVNNLLQSLSKQKELKERSKVMTSANFRSSYQPRGRSDSAKLQEVLQSTVVDLKQNDLINYLSQTKNCNPIVFDKISKAKSNEISKLNKVCQMVLVNRAQEKETKENMKLKLMGRMQLTKDTLNTNLKRLKQDMDAYTQIVERYAKKCSKRNAYIENHYVMEQRYWKRFDFERLNFKRKQRQKTGQLVLTVEQRAFSQGNIFNETMNNLMLQASDD